MFWWLIGIGIAVAIGVGVWFLNARMNKYQEATNKLENYLSSMGCTWLSNLLACFVIGQFRKAGAMLHDLIMDDKSNIDLFDERIAKPIYEYYKRKIESQEVEE